MAAGRAAEQDTAVGEVHIRGPTVFNGYLGRPAASATAFLPGGWFATGDLAAWRGVGYLEVCVT
jgi:malonyl-CoA/methylmalonyl-CoA synthetase